MAVWVGARLVDRCGEPSDCVRWHQVRRALAVDGLGAAHHRYRVVRMDHGDVRYPAAASPYAAEAIDTLHVLGAGGWIGSLSIMMFLSVPTFLRSSDEHKHHTVARMVAAFSPIALVFAALLSITGVFAGWRNVGSWSALFQSD